MSMPNKKFLKKLKGLTIKDARIEVLKIGYEPYAIPEGSMAMTTLALPKTIVLWQKAGKVEKAVLGDPTEEF
jgi:hypothetical protein